MPEYLTKLEEAYAELVPLADDVAEFRAALRGDLHLHSDWSDGGSPIREMAEAAMALGHEYMALTDHSPRLTVANGLTAERLEQQLDVVAALNEELAPFRILTGIECDINVDGSLDQTDELLGRLDVVVASVHSDLRADSKSMTARMLTAVANPHTDVLGHCTGRLVIGRRQRNGTQKPRPESQFDAEAVFARLRRVRHRGRDQLPARAAGPAEAAARAGRRAGLRVRHRHRRARARSARLAGQRLRAGGRVRRAGRPGHQHLAGRGAARLGGGPPERVADPAHDEAKGRSTRGRSMQDGRRTRGTWLTMA